MSARSWHEQRGAATLVVVMVLFFIMAMMAAVANRGLVFEQRIATNYYRSGLALETADAGAEWALAQLNGGNIDTACRSTANAGTSFRQRYLSFASDGVISVRTDADDGVDPGSSACIFVAGAGLQCQCPADGVLSAPVVADAAKMQPMYTIQFLPTPRAGVVRIRAMGCTDQDASCRSIDVSSSTGLARSRVETHVALLSALKNPPALPLTVRGNVDFGAAALGLHQPDAARGGVLLQAGGDLSGTIDRSTSSAGTPVADAMITRDPGLAAITSEDMHRRYFGMLPETYRSQPVIRSVQCGADCGPALQAAYASGARVLWVPGPAVISSRIDLGSATDPVLLVVDGPLSLDGPMSMAGLVHVRGDADWSNGTGLPSLLIGAMTVEGSLRASGGVDISFSASAIDILNKQRGSFVRVPGSWKENL